VKRKEQEMNGMMRSAEAIREKKKMRVDYICYENSKKKKKLISKRK
jgi:hypothetical protein